MTVPNRFFPRGGHVDEVERERDLDELLRGFDGHSH
jgi:hypothetical protein